MARQRMRGDCSPITEANILRWAAGAPVRLPDFAGVRDERLLYLLGINEDRVLSLIGEHRLAHPFVQRALRERPGWCSRALLGGAMDLCQAVAANLRRQVEAVREVADVLRSSGHPPIVIKGYTAYALTGDSSAIRFSKDLDLFHADPEHLWKVLTKLGYAGTRKATHELGSMRRDSLEIEVHHRFPIFGYPEFLRGFDVTPAARPGYWIQRFPVYQPCECSNIDYSDLFEHSCRGPTAETADLVVAEPNLAVLIRCAHEIVNRFRRAFALPRLRLQLGVLSEILLLTRHPAFKPAMFHALVDRLGARDAVLLVGHWLQTYFGRNPLAHSRPLTRLVSRRARQTAFPQILTHYGCWACLDKDENLLLPLDWQGVVATLGASRITASPGGESHRRSVDVSASSPPAERVILQTERDHRLPFEFSVAWDWQRLALEVTFVKSLERDYQYQVEVYGDQIPGLFHGVRLRDQGRHVHQDFGEFGAGESSVSPCSAGCVVKISFPWKALPRWFRSRDPKPLMLQVMRRAETSTRDFDPVILVPLEIRRA